MTQYHYEKPTTTAVESQTNSKQDRESLEKDLKSLRDRVDHQDEQLRDLQRLVKKLQNEVRIAVNAFNLKNHG